MGEDEPTHVCPICGELGDQPHQVRVHYAYKVGIPTPESRKHLNYRLPLVRNSSHDLNIGLLRARYTSGLRQR